MKIRLTEYGNGEWIWEVKANLYQHGKDVVYWRRIDHNRYKNKHQALDAARRYEEGREMIRLSTVVKEQEEIEI